MLVVPGHVQSLQEWQQSSPGMSASSKETKGKNLTCLNKFPFFNVSGKVNRYLFKIFRHKSERENKTEAQSVKNFQGNDSKHDILQKKK